MRIDGKLLAQEIFSEIKHESLRLPKTITPCLAIITVGEESSWETYVKQKQKRAQELGFATKVISLSHPHESQIIQTIQEMNRDNSVHGIIVQRPLPHTINTEEITRMIYPEKDIDGFRPDSPFQPPIWLAVRYILEYIYDSSNPTLPFTDWLKSQKITIVGKGDTAGKPVMKGLYNIGIIATVVDSKTDNKENIFQSSDIIISGVGKTVIDSSAVKPGAILIGIGIRKENNVLQGDYHEDSIETIASWYTPTPGGVGRVNLAFLMSNLLKATKIQMPS